MRALRQIRNSYAKSPAKCAEIVSQSLDVVRMIEVIEAIESFTLVGG